MSNEIQVKSAEVLQVLNKAEIDVQISTAKQFPRDVFQSLNRIRTIATLDNETAADCFYALSRQGQRIEGVSVRLAEIIASAWGNLRVQTRIVGNDGKVVTAQAICHDLETNVAISIEVPRRITDRNGRTFSEDMQVTTANAASAIAFRNAVLKVVPKAVTNRIIEEIKEVAIGKSIDLETRRKAMIDWYGKIGVPAQAILSYVGAKRVEEIDNQMVFELKGLANAIKEGTTTIKEVFNSASIENDTKAITDEAKKQGQEILKKVEIATAQAVGQTTLALETEKK